MNDPHILGQVQIPWSWLSTKAVGTAVSFVTAGASFLAGRFWKTVLKPYAQSFTWSGLQLGSTYVGTSELDGKLYQDHIELKQHASRVSGTIYTPAARSGKYVFKAELLNGILRGTFEGVERTSPAQGSFVLALNTGATDLVGYGIEPFEGSIVTYKYVWQRRSV